MKHQQIQLASKRNFIRLMALAVMLVLMVCCTALLSSAANDEVVLDLSGAGFELNENGYWEKEYAGSNTTVEGVKVNGTPVTAVLDDPNVIEGFNTLTVTYGEEVIELPVEITPATLAWADGVKGTTVVAYNISGAYTGAVTIPEGALDIAKATALNETVAIANGNYEVSFNFTGCGSTTAYVNVALDNSNYTVAPLLVDIEVAPAAIDSINWEGVAESFTYGDAALLNVSALGNGQIPLIVLVKVGEEYLTLAEAFGEYGLAVGTYELSVEPVSSYYVLDGDVVIEKTLTVTKAVYEVVLKDGEFVNNGELSKPEGSLGYTLVVEGKDGAYIPEWILSAITYKYTLNGTTYEKVTAPGVYTVEAIMPKLDNVEVKIAKATATMTVISVYEVISTPDGAIVIIGQGGIATTVETGVTVPEKIARPALRGLNAYKAYTLTINGAGNQVFSVRIPVSQDLIGKNLLPLTEADLYIYDAAAGTKEAANNKYRVTLSEDRLYYVVEGYVSVGDITFLIAPEYDTPFWASAIGITLLVLLALVLIIVIPMAIGLMLIRIERSGRNPIITIETKGNAPAVQPVVIPDKIGSADEIVENGLNDMADAFFQEIPAEEEEYDVDATEATAEAMAQFHKELAEFDVEAYEAAQMAIAGAAAEAIADELARKLMEEVPAESADVSDEVKQTVADLMAENFNQSADATDAIALVTEEEVVEEEPAVEEVAEEVVEEVVEEPVQEEIAEEVVEEVVEEATEENDNDESDDDDDDSFGGFGSMPLEYIDAIAEAERYAEMLEQERRGEVQLVTRYRRSYLSRLAQSQGSIQDYYNAIKNLLLSYKGVKSRISWNFESFNVGRTPLAKFNAKTRTLYVYIALSAEELADTKYNFTDMSAKKKYAAVPVLLKVKGDRKFKHALELITKLCEEKLQLPKKKVVEEVDYRMPFKTTEELVNEGIVKMLVAAIPLTESAAQETVVEETPVEEVAVQEAVEETPAEEAVAEEVVEEVAEEVATEEEAPVEEDFIEEEPVEEVLPGVFKFEEAPVEEAPQEEAVVEEVVEEAPVEEIPQEAVEEEIIEEEEPVEVVLGEETIAEDTNQNA